VTELTKQLLEMLDDLNQVTTDVMATLVAGALPPDVQTRCGQLFVRTGRLLELHADVVRANALMDGGQPVSDDIVQRLDEFLGGEPNERTRA
jgi:hypothetical protein